MPLTPEQEIIDRIGKELTNIKKAGPPIPNSANLQVGIDANTNAIKLKMNQSLGAANAGKYLRADGNGNLLPVSLTFNNFIGMFATVTDLRATTKIPKEGDYGLVGTGSPQTMYIWEKDPNSGIFSWVSSGVTTVGDPDQILADSMANSVHQHEQLFATTGDIAAAYPVTITVNGKTAQHAIHVGDTAYVGVHPNIAMFRYDGTNWVGNGGPMQNQTGSLWTVGDFKWSYDTTLDVTSAGKWQKADGSAIAPAKGAAIALFGANIPEVKPGFAITQGAVMGLETKGQIGEHDHVGSQSGYVGGGNYPYGETSRGSTPAKRDKYYQTTGNITNSLTSKEGSARGNLAASIGLTGYFYVG